MALSPPNSLTARKQHVVNKTTSLSSSSSSSSSALVEDDAAISTPIPVSKWHRIWLSDVVVIRPKTYFLRKWNVKDIRRLVMMLIVHVLAMFGPFTFSWAAFWVAVILAVLTGPVGITLSYHRNLSHLSFKLPKWLEYFLAYLGSLALQGDPITWVSAHRFHHKFVDTEKDPHSPLEGFWFSHINWILDTNSLAKKRGGQNNVEDLKKQTFYMLMRRTYILHPLALGLILYAIGGFSYVVWGVGVRTTSTFHFTFFVNSICHIWGNQAWNTGDLSKNNWLIGICAGGEGWHNNHHAFEYSARHGLEWWQIDTTWYTIKLLEALGLATDVKLPTEAHKQRLAFKSNKEMA